METIKTSQHMHMEASGPIGKTDYTGGMKISRQSWKQQCGTLRKVTKTVKQATVRLIGSGKLACDFAGACDTSCRCVYVIAGI